MSGELQAVVHHVRQLAAASSLAERTDAELLRLFVADRDEAAFAVLVRRHGRLIRSVCRHVLRHEEDVEDALQATLLIFARKAATIRKGQALSSWLHGVAYRTALNARKSAARRQVHERCAETRQDEQPIRQAMLRELQAILDEEVRRLPEKYRLPFTQCYLEGKSKSEAARELGWKEGTVSGRLAQARERLRRSLMRRGVSLSAALCALALSQDAVSASIPAAMIRGALSSAMGRTDGVSAAASVLAEEMLAAMGAIKIRWALALVLVGSVTALSAGLTAIRPQAAKQAESKPEATSSAAPARGPARAEEARTSEQKPRTDLYGDPLPPGALARMGTIRYAHGDLIHGYPVFAPDHKMFATVSRQTPYRQGSVVCLWDAATGKELRHLDDADFEPYQVFFLKSENRLGILSISRTPVQGKTYAYAIHFWNPSTGEKKSGHLQALGQPFEPCALSSDEKWLVSASREPPVRVRDRKTGKVLAEWLGDGTRVNHLAFSPDGNTVAICHEKAIHFWDWKANRETGQLNDFPGQSNVWRLCFSPNGRWASASIINEGLRIWDTKGWKEVRRIKGEYGIRFFLDGKRWVSTDTGVIWDLSSGKQQGRFENYTRCQTLDISADGRSATGYALGRIRRWDANTGKDLSPPASTIPTAHRMMIHQIGFLPDGKSVASASPDGAVRVWDAATGKELRTLIQGKGWEPQSTLPTLMRVAPSGSIMVAHKNRLSFFQNGGKAEEVTLTDFPANGLASLNISPDGKTLLLAASNRLVQLWDLPSRKTVASFSAPEGTHLECLGISSDRRRIAASIGREVRLLSGSEEVGRLLEKPPEPPARAAGVKGEYEQGYSYFHGIQAFAFSPDGEVLASGGYLDGALKLLDVSAGRPRHILSPPAPEYHHYELRNIVFSPNGRMIAAELEPGVVDIWETSTGQRRRRFLGHRSYQTTLAFSPDGARLATGNRDTTILIWDVFGVSSGNAPAAAPLTENELTALWSRLREADAERACRIMGQLMRCPTLSVPFLRWQLLSRKVPETARLRDWIADLDNDQFSKRETAANELAKYLPLAEPLLKERLAGKPSLEVRRRIENLLSLMQSQHLPPDTIRDLRALEVLEYCGAAAITKVARELKQGNFDPRIAAAAKVAAQRLRTRSP